MKIGLVDVDGHNFPNLALMRISAYHKAAGDQVEWWFGPIIHYDRVYKSKVFSFTPDVEVWNADEIIAGGTGYAISLENGIERFNLKALCNNLPTEIESMMPDYSIYPNVKYALAMTSRGCPRGCPFCHVGPKEGRYARKVADVKDFWTGQKEIKVLDANITALKDAEKRDLLRQYKDTGAWIDFTQGLDIRLVTDADIADINAMKIKQIHFAWDNPKDDLRDHFMRYAELAEHKPHGNNGMVYVLTNYDSTLEEDLYRIYTLRDFGFDPYVMIYDKMHAAREKKHLQRWCNSKWIFRSEPDFKKYMPTVR